MLERWITETPFREAEAPAQSDLDVAKGANAKEILERHWDTWITEADWAWLAEKGINTVRIPVSSTLILTASRRCGDVPVGRPAVRAHFAESIPLGRLVITIFAGSIPRCSNAPTSRGLKQSSRERGAGSPTPSQPPISTGSPCSSVCVQAVRPSFNVD